MAIVNLHVTITGRVQGISFRYFASQEAEKLGVTGWIRNESDGTVSLEIEGETEIVDKMLAWCRHGPKWASVAKVNAVPGSLQNYSSFEIKS